MYDLGESESVYYVIRLKSNAVLQRMADELLLATEVSDITRFEHYYEEIEYQAKSWSKSRKVIVQSVRTAEEFFLPNPFL